MEHQVSVGIRTDDASLCDYRVVEDNASMFVADVSNTLRVDERREVFEDYMERHARTLIPCGICDRCSPPPPPWA